MFIFIQSDVYVDILPHVRRFQHWAILIQGIHPVRALAVLQYRTQFSYGVSAGSISSYTLENTGIWVPGQASGWSRTWRMGKTAVHLIDKVTSLLPEVGGIRTIW